MSKTLLAVWLIGMISAFGCAQAQAAAPTHRLVENGHSDYVIVCQGNSFDTFAGMRGAMQLQSYIAQISGARIPIVNCAGDMPDKAIIVGLNPYTDQLNIHLDARLGDDGFLIKTLGDRIILAGPGKRGTMYACYELLEKLGVRWFTSTITRIPRQETITLDDIEETQIPSFEYREPMFTEALEPDWCAHLRCNSSWAPLDAGHGGKFKYSPYFVHTLWRIIPAARYGDHPEYFPLIDGKRVVKEREVQRCLSNPEVLKIAIDTVNHWIDLDPSGQIFSVSQNDTANFCTCDNCKKLMDRYGGPSGEFLWFVNQVAEAVGKQHPDKLIDTLAYQFTEPPPIGIKPRANVRVRLCPISACEAHPYEQCTSNSNKEFVAHLKGWAAITDNLYIWHYSTDFHHYLMPFPDFNQFPDSIRLYKRSGVKGIFFEGDNDPGGGASDAELRSYVMAHLLWNSAADASKLVDEWMNGVYGAQAAKPMREWFDLLHEQVRAPDKHLFIYDDPTPEIFSPAVITKGEQLLTSAAQLAAADPVATQYVKKAQLDLRYVQFAQHPSDGKDFDQFLADVRSFGIQNLAEGRPLEKWLPQYLEQARKNAATTHPAK